MMVQRMSDAWRLAWDNVSMAQKKQKAQHDRYARPAEFDVGNRVFVLMPAGPAYKLARPFHGHFWVIAINANVVDVCLVDRPEAASPYVSKCRMRRCPPEIPDTYGLGKASPILPGTANTADSSVEDSVWTGRLRSSKHCSPGTGGLQLRMGMCNNLCLDRLIS